MTEQLSADFTGATTTHEVESFLRGHHVVLVAEGGEPMLVTRLPFVIGRGRRATMSLENETISRRHAILRLSATGQLELVDPGSSNGSFVNGERVSSALLVDGDEIRLGSARYQLVIESRGPTNHVLD